MLKVNPTVFCVPYYKLIWYLKFLLVFASLCLHNNIANANPQTPSQALPDFFKKYSQPDFFDLNDKQKSIPEIPKKLNLNRKVEIKRIFLEENAQN